MTDTHFAEGLETDSAFGELHPMCVLLPHQGNLNHEFIQQESWGQQKKREKPKNERMNQACIRSTEPLIYLESANQFFIFPCVSCILSDQTFPYFHIHIHSFIFLTSSLSLLEGKKCLSVACSVSFSRIKEVNIQVRWTQLKWFITVELCGRWGGAGYISHSFPMRFPQCSVDAYMTPHRATSFSLFLSLKKRKGCTKIVSTPNLFFF